MTKVFAGSDRPAVQELSLEIPEGEVVALVGPSGCGKTTTLRMVNRLVEPTSGTIRVAGTDVMAQDPVALRRGIGYVIQSVGLLPHRTIEQNIATVPRLLGWDRTRTGERVRELATLLELDEQLLPRYPHELSGGQQQRVGVARALAADPPVMLMDEPFAAVDPVVRGRLRAQFVALQARLRKTIVIVTHDIDEAIAMADRIAVLSTGATVEQYAPPEEVLRDPANAFVAGFLGSERGLKRLALTRVGEISLGEGPVVGSTDPAKVALGAMAAVGSDWTSVVDGDGRLLGWVDHASLGGAGRVDDVRPQPFSASITASSTLREALDAIVSSRTGVAAVVDERGRYRGILTLDGVTRAIAR